MYAQTRAAGRRQNGGTGLGQILQDSQLIRFHPDPLGSGGYQQLRALIDLLALEDPSRCPQIVEPSAGAAAQIGPVHPGALSQGVGEGLRNGMDVVHVMRAGYLRLQFRGIEFQNLGIVGARIA